MHDHHYILDENNNLMPVDLETYWQWFKAQDEKGEASRRIVKQRHWPLNSIMVSTVFLGLDHNFFWGGPPLVFETLVFGGPLDQEMDRYSTYDEAVRGHEAMCERVRAALATENSEEGGE